MLIQDVKRPVRHTKPKPGDIISRKLRRLTHRNQGLNNKQRRQFGIKTDHQLPNKNVWDITHRFKNQ